MTVSWVSGGIQAKGNSVWPENCYEPVFTGSGGGVTNEIKNDHAILIGAGVPLLFLAVMRSACCGIAPSIVMIRQALS